MAVPIEQCNQIISFLAEKPAYVLDANNENQPLSAASSCNEASTSSQDSATQDQQEIWVKNSGKTTPQDLKARDDLIDLYRSDKYQKLFGDKKTTKKKVWEALGYEMMGKGYYFGDRDPGKVCSQKWRNMESETLKVIANAGPKNTGGGHIKKPSYFNDVHDVVKDKAKACPKNILDSLEAVQSTPESCNVKKKSNTPVEEKLSYEEEEQARDEASKPSLFLKVKTSSQPKKGVNNNAILEFLQADAAKRDK